MSKQFPRRKHPLFGCFLCLYARAFTDLKVVTVILLALLAALPSLAQIKITYPVSRQIVQRDNNNQATVQIAGSYGQPLDAVEARAVARAAGQGVTSDWTILQTNPSNGQFSGTMVVKGGWYTLEVRGMKGGAVVATHALDRFGVGEVFAIMGHSNAQGSGCNVNGSNGCPTIDGARDDRVNVVGLDQNSADFNKYLETADTRYLPGLNFSQLLLNSGMAPFAKMPWLWGHMGDILVAQIKVPVLLYNAGFGGTNMQQTYWAAYDIPFYHSFVRYDLRMPYANVRNMMNLYIPTTGIRAILVHHGLNDRSNSTEETVRYYRGVIDKIRTEFNKPDLSFVIGLDSYLGGTYDNIRSAQFQVINPTGYKTFQGPDLDLINSIQDRPDGAHYSQSGQMKAGEAWANAITDAYLSASTPYAGQLQPLTNVSCAPNNQLTLTQPDGYQPTWNTGSTANSLTVGGGTYSARIIDAQNKILFPPAVVVPASVQPERPTVSSNDGTMNICLSSGLTLRSSYAGPNYWSTGSTASSIVATKPGIYTLQAKNPVYGCLSESVSNNIGRAPTDLGLLIQPSRKVIAVNDTVSYRLTVENKGGCDAGRITFENRVPPNMTIVSTSSDLTILKGDLYGRVKMIFGLISQLPAGQSVSSTYVTRATAAGTYITAGELITVANPDPNSEPANGTENSEDDEARAEVRTDPSSPSVFKSPNPNQPPPNSGEADISLAMQSSSRFVDVGKMVSFTLTVSNRGALTATHIGVRNVLPVELQFVSSASGMQANQGVLSAGISQLAPGQSIRLEFIARVVNAGVFINKAQIDASDQPDFDSTPNNGYSNREDDQASIELRTVVEN